ncbi:AAA domain-containing protein [Favolaschia claudopus]|uniref:AAA domain-containing protein n=1 Tax=Favolaschia claudopus TaxID=2862362 RepID=A0AAW0D6S5_9AGAR
MSLQRRVYVVGPSSTGKTTLCDALAKRLGIEENRLIKEVARTVIKELGLSRSDIGLLDMQKAIMLGHLKREQECEAETYLSDRSAVDPIVYAIFTAANAQDAVARKETLVSLPEFQEALPRYRQSLFILLGTVREWVVDDGFRHVGDETKLLTIFRDVLVELGIRYREIGSEMRFLPERTAFLESLATGPH